MNPNCINVNVTGYLKAVRICFAVLFESALERYHRKQSKTNLRAVGDNASLWLMERERARRNEKDDGEFECRSAKA
jgi:hypothetical protein